MEAAVQRAFPVVWSLLDQTIDRPTQVDENSRVGVFASFDRREGGYDFGDLHETVSSVLADRPVEAFAPD